MLDAEYLAHCLDLLYRRTLNEELPEDVRADTAYALADLELRLHDNAALARLVDDIRAEDA